MADTPILIFYNTNCLNALYNPILAECDITHTLFEGFNDIFWAYILSL